MFDDPTFLVQIGHQGEGLAESAVNGGYADGAIISPVDTKVTQARQVAAALNNAGGTVLFDPQFYEPRSEDESLRTYNYYSNYGGDSSEENFFNDSTGFTTQNIEDKEWREGLCKEIIGIQKSLEVDAYLSPSIFLKNLSDTNLRYWQDLTDTFVRMVNEELGEVTIFASLPVDGEAIAEKPQRGNLLNWSTSVDVDGFYLTVNHDYPFTDKNILYGYLNLVKNLKVNRFKVILGHSHHVSHLFLGLGADGFGAGHHLNTRRFAESRWETSGEESDDGGQSITRYYSEPLLNELRVRAPALEDNPGAYSDLDLLAGAGFDLERIRTHSPFEEELFETDQPSESEWNKKDGAWTHYLWSCNNIAKQYEKQTLQEKTEGEAEIWEARLEYAQMKIQSASALYEEVKEHALLSEPDEKIYDSWLSAFEKVKEEAVRDYR